MVRTSTHTASAPRQLSRSGYYPSSQIQPRRGAVSTCTSALSSSPLGRHRDTGGTLTQSHGRGTYGRGGALRKNIAGRRQRDTARPGASGRHPEPPRLAPVTHPDGPAPGSCFGAGDPPMGVTALVRASAGGASGPIEPNELRGVPRTPVEPPPQSQRTSEHALHLFGWEPAARSSPRASPLSFVGWRWVFSLSLRSCRVVYPEFMGRVDTWLECNGWSENNFVLGPRAASALGREQFCSRAESRLCPRPPLSLSLFSCPAVLDWWPARGLEILKFLPIVYTSCSATAG